MKKTLITGATGNLGQLVVAALKQQTAAEDIVVLVRDAEQQIARQYKNEGIELRVGSYDDPESLDQAMKGIQQIYLISGNDLEARLSQHINVIKAAQKNHIEQLLYSSSVRKTESSQAPLDPVISGHARTEKAIIDSGITYTILRHNLYSDIIPLFIGDKEQLLQTRAIYLPTENGKVAFVPREDFAEAEANILIAPEKHANKIYEFNGSQLTDFNQISEIISGIVKEKINYVSPEVKEFEAKMKEAGLPEAVISLLSMFSQGIANGEFNFDQTDLEGILGRKTTSIESYLTRVYA